MKSKAKLYAVTHRFHLPQPDGSLGVVILNKRKGWKPTPDERDLLLRITGATYGLIGLVLAGAGGWLAVLGGSPYYFLVGGALGLTFALATAHLLRSMLFSIGPYDPLSFLAVAALLAMVALAATLVPAREAMKLDPIAALRYE